MLKANRDVKVCSLVEVKICPQYGLIKKFKMDLTKASRNKDTEYTKYQLFMLGNHNFVLSIHF